jgi:hypothetical protein
MFCNVEAPKKHAMTHSHSVWSNHPMHCSIGSLCDGSARYEGVESLTEIRDEMSSSVAETETPCESVLAKNWAEIRVQ